MVLPLPRWKKKLYKISFIVLIISLILSLIINVIKYISQLQNQQWIELLFVRQAYICLPLLFITSRWSNHLLDSIGNAIILSIFHTLQNNESDIIETPEKGNFYDDEEDEHNERSLKITLGRFQSRLFFNYFIKLLLFHNKTLSIPPSLSSSVERSSLLELIGSITTLCIIDKQGILSDNTNYIEKICFFDGDKITVLELSRDHNESSTVTVNNNSFNNTSFELYNNNSDIDIHDSCNNENLNTQPSFQYKLQFNDPDWENYLPSLKPLGLNCLLNSFCKFGSYNDSIDRQSVGILHSDKQIETLASSCNCLLGTRIGFSEGALDNFYALTNVYRVGNCTEFLNSLNLENSYDSEKENESQQRASKYGYRYYPRHNEEDGSHKIIGYSISTVVQDSNSGSLQLLSKGSTALILSNTIFAWDGSELHQITVEDYVNILDFEKKWSAFQCIAFSYQPIPEDYYNILDDVQTDDLGKLVINKPKMRPNSLERISFDDSLRQLRKTSVDSVTSIHKLNDDDNVEEVNEWQELMELSPIFIGMIAMRQLPKFGVEDFINNLKLCGTRFVHFSRDNLRSTKAFSERLGLETDWNCAIDLHDGVTKVENAPSALPKGISNIRSHLSDIDDVPLLVPTFYNCTEESILEMIKIFQEKGDIVCCIGNACKYTNFPVYLQADISIGWQPQKSECLNCTDDIYNNRISSANFISDYTSGSFSIDLNCLSCELIMHKDSSFNSITALIQIGRQYFTNLRQALSFYIACLLLLHFILLFSYLSFLPTIFTGIHIFWLFFCILPILSCSLMFSPRNKDVMRIMNTKRNQFLDEYFNRAIISYLCIIIPFSILFVLYFGVSLSLIWGTQGESISDIFGFSPAIKTIKFQNSLIVAQNTTFTCFILSIVSWSFCYIQHYQSFFSYPKQYFSIIWIISVLLIIILQIIFTFAMININIILFITWNCFMIIPTIIICFLILCCEFIIKNRFRSWYKQEQQFMALEFNTKLGMYSPVSPF